MTTADRWEYRPHHGGGGDFGTKTHVLDLLDYHGCGDVYGPGDDGEHIAMRCLECEPNEIAPIQWQRSLALARAHGHGWSYGRDDRGYGWGPDDAHPSTWSAARAEYEDATWELPMPGIGPSPIHTTGTGRMTWAVEPDGAVTISVFRPGNVEVLRAVVDHDGRLTITWDDTQASIHERHAHALHYALVAIGALPEWITADGEDFDHEGFCDLALPGVPVGVVSPDGPPARFRGPEPSPLGGARGARASRGSDHVNA